MQDAPTPPDFLARAYDRLSAEGDVFPHAWVAAAWRDGTLQDEVAYELSRSVAKSGSFDLAHPLGSSCSHPFSCQAKQSRSSSKFATTESDSSLNGAVRFESAFPSAAPLLPSSNDIAALCADLFDCVESGGWPRASVTPFDLDNSPRRQTSSARTSRGRRHAARPGPVKEPRPHGHPHPRGY